MYRYGTGTTVPVQLDTTGKYRTSDRRVPCALRRVADTIVLPVNVT